MRSAIMATLLWFPLTILTDSWQAQAAAQEAPTVVRQAIDMPAQPLDRALRALAHDRGFQIVYQAELVRPFRTEGVTGELTQEEVLAQLLSGTGLATRRVDDRTVAIVQDETTSAFNSESAGRPWMANSMPYGASAAGAGSVAASRRSGGQQNPSVPERQGVSESGGGAIEEVLVTGSRIARTGFDTPVPLTVVTTDRLLATEPLITQGLHQLPSLLVGGSRRAATSTRGTGQADINIRALGSARTLILLDGRRLVPEGGAGIVDTNLIPAALVSRVEVVTGGASAAYGSDAVSGVVNFVLDEEFTGFKGSLMEGMSSRSDRPERKAELAFGTALFDGRGHLLLSAEYYDAEALPQGARSWASIGANIISNLPGSLPIRLRVTDARRADSNPAGLIVGGPLDGTTFTDGGTPRPFVFGDFRTSGNTIGGEGVRSTLGDTWGLATKYHRSSIFARASFDLNDDFSFYVENIAALRHNDFAIGTAAYANGSRALTIRRDNAFLPESLRDQMTGMGLESFRMGKIFTEIPYQHIDTRVEVWRPLVGATFNLGNWSGRAYYQHGKVERMNTNPQNLDQLRLNEAIDAVVVPESGAPASLVPGTIVCRSTLNDPTNGCIPFDPFGTSSNSLDAIYAVTGGPWLDFDGRFGTPRESQFHREVYQQDVASISISGDLIDGWAGPISAATGAEYRKEQVDVTADPYSQIFNPQTQGFGGWRSGSVLPYNGDVEVKEVFAEVAVPLTEHAEFGGAARLTDYSTSGDVETWKLGATYRLFQDVLIRTTRSRDIAAPSLANLYRAGTSGNSTLFDPFRDITVGGVRTFQRGNPNLDPEIGDTTVMGFVYQPSQVPGLSVSVDYWDIKVAGAFGSVGTQEVLDRCFADSASGLCGFIDRASTGEILAINNQPFNFEELKTDGLDIDLEYRTVIGPWMPIVSDANLTLRALASKINHRITSSPGSQELDEAGENTGEAPTWRGLFRMTVDKNPVALTLSARYVSEGTYDNTFVEGIDINDNTIPSYVTVGANLSYWLSDVGPEWAESRLYLAASNLLDRDPPRVERNGTQPSATNQMLYDSLGQYWRLGFDFRF